MKPAETILLSLRRDARLYEELLQCATDENQQLRKESSPDPSSDSTVRRKLLRELEQSLENLKSIRLAWSKLDLRERGLHSEIASQVRSNQEMVMRILSMDRDNEQGRLRRGLLPPRALPAARRQEAGFVANTYRRNAPSKRGA